MLPESLRRVLLSRLVRARRVTQISRQVGQGLGPSPGRTPPGGMLKVRGTGSLRDSLGGGSRRAGLPLYWALEHSRTFQSEPVRRLEFCGAGGGRLGPAFRRRSLGSEDRTESSQARARGTANGFLPNQLRDFVSVLLIFPLFKQRI